MASSEESTTQEVSLRVPANKEGVPHTGKEGRTEGRARGKGRERRGEKQRSGEREEGRWGEEKSEEKEKEEGRGRNGKGGLSQDPALSPCPPVTASCPWSCIWGLLRKHRVSLSAELVLGLDLSPLCVCCTCRSQTHAPRSPEQWLGAAQAEVWLGHGGAPRKMPPLPRPHQMGLAESRATEFLERLQGWSP